MEVENKLKAMGLELPATAPPPPGRAGAVKVGNVLFVGGHTPGEMHRGKLGADSCWGFPSQNLPIGLRPGSTPSTVGTILRADHA